MAKPGESVVRYWAQSSPLKMTMDDRGWGTYSLGSSCTGILEDSDKRQILLKSEGAYSSERSTVTYLNHQGGIKSPSLLKRFKFQHYTSEVPRSDWLSRKPVHQENWELDQQVFCQVTDRCGMPSIDLFASLLSQS